MTNHEKFLQSIQDKKYLSVRFNSNEKGDIERKCVPFDFGPNKKKNSSDLSNRYHFWNISSPDGPHNLPLLPSQIISIELLDEQFEPGDYVTWVPNWTLKRDWGPFS